MGGKSLSIIGKDHVGGSQRQTPRVGLDSLEIGSGEVSLDGKSTRLVFKFAIGGMFKSDERSGLLVAIRPLGR